MEMRISKSRTVKVRFEGHIPQNDLRTVVNLIVLLEKGSIIRMEESDAKPIS
jgi:hypothetical protein